jgi:hypothetical protein
MRQHAVVNAFKSARMRVGLHCGTYMDVWGKLGKEGFISVIFQHALTAQVEYTMHHVFRHVFCAQEALVERTVVKLRD